VRFRWPIQVRLRWCPSCNVPLIQDYCSRCGSKGFEVKVNPPGDVRPVFSGDVEIIKESIKNEFGDYSLMNLLGIDRGLVLVNKVPHYDDMKEVIVGGVVVGRYFFDPLRLKWRWRLSRYSAEVAVNIGLVKSVVVDRVKPLEVIRDSNDLEDTQYVIIDRNGDVLGIGVVRSGKVRVQTIFSKNINTEVISKPNSLQDFIRSNDLILRILTSRGIKHAYVMNSKVRLPTTISYSGGKDSLVALDLALRAGLEPKVVFNDTGLELPETLDNVVMVSNYYGLELHEARPDKTFWDYLDIFGPPAKDFRWCCKLIKLIPLAKLYKGMFPQGALNIIGQRGFESIDRALSGRVWRNRWISHILNITLIQEWPQIAVWAYIISNKLKYNPLYERGFDRLGCYLCPAANIAEYYMVGKYYPSLWSLWEELLTRWARRLNLPESWVRYSLWRWLNPLASGRRRVEIKCLGKGFRSDWVSEYERRLGISILSKELKVNHSKLVFNVVIPHESLINQLGLLGRLSVVKNGDLLELHSDDYVIKLSRNTLEVSIRNVLKVNALDLMSKVVKVIIRWLKCVGCGACSLWCPSKAIELVNGKPTINNTKCLSCGVCLEVCPVSEVLVSKVLIPIITGGLSRNTEGITSRRTPKIITLSKSSRSYLIGRKDSIGYDTDLSIPDNFFSC